MPSIFGDKMVLQEQAQVSLWGHASPGTKVIAQASWSGSSKSTTADAKGEWRIKIDTPEASFNPQTLKVKSVDESIEFNQILIGQVWLCSGQSNMQFSLRNAQSGPAEIKKADFPNIRLYNGARVHSSVPLKESKGSWQSCHPDTVAGFSAVGYFFGKELYQKINKPIGLICLSWGGTPIQAWMRPGTTDEFGAHNQYLEQHWKSKIAQYEKSNERYQAEMQRWQNEVKHNADAPRPEKPKPIRWQNQSHYCYNGMIAPIVGYTLAGVIWYQGEANTPGNSFPYYQTQFADMIRDWRKIWGQKDLPFFFVQLAASKGYGTGVMYIRQAQTETFKNVPHTGMAVTMDIGDATDHHPKNKRDVGYRLALWAMKQCYGQNDMVPSGPIYRSKKREGNKLRLYFDYAGGGLVAKDGELTDFAVCGPDQKFHPAKAVIDGNTIVVYSEKVPEPQHASFAWCEYAEPNFYNKQGLPASPFNTLTLNDN